MRKKELVNDIEAYTKRPLKTTKNKRRMKKKTVMFDLASLYH